MLEKKEPFGARSFSAMWMNVRNPWTVKAVFISATEIKEGFNICGVYSKRLSHHAQHRNLRNDHNPG
jgi:hypothetical protein